MIDIQQPSFELRTAILLIKSQANNLDLPMELAQLISSKVDGARRIEGIVKLLRSEVELKQKTINEELIQSLLKTEAPTNVSIIRAKPQDVIKTVANHYRIKQSALKGKRRTKEIVNARHSAMFLLRKELNMPLEEIGKWFSGRDHTSVLHAINKIEKEISEEGLMKQDISAIRMSLTVVAKG
jgi:chromosomal replication initiator protein